MPRYIKITVATGFIGATHYDECEIPEDWDEMTQDERESFLNEVAEDSVGNFIDAYAEVVDEG